MSRAGYVRQKIHEAAEHPNAVRIFAMGAERPTPQSAASAAYALGFTVKEEKLAKWVGILKRDSEILFGLPFHDALREILANSEDDEMKTKRGSGFFEQKSCKLIEKLVIDTLRAGISFGNPFKFFREISISNIDLERIKQTGLWNMSSGSDILFSCYFKYIPRSNKKDGEIINYVMYGGFRIYPSIARGNTDEARMHCVADEGFLDMDIRVKDKRAMKAVHAFAKGWEAKSRQLKGGREATVTIYQDYAD